MSKNRRMLIRASSHARTVAHTRRAQRLAFPRESPASHQPGSFARHAGHALRTSACCCCTQIAHPRCGHLDALFPKRPRTPSPLAAPESCMGVRRAPPVRLWPFASQKTSIPGSLSTRGQISKDQGVRVELPSLQTEIDQVTVDRQLIRIVSRSGSSTGSRQWP